MADFLAPEPEPKPKMPMSKTVFSLALAFFFDALKFACTMLVFFAPLLVGVFAYNAVGGPEFIKEGAAVAATAAAGYLSFLGAPVIQVIGVILGMIVALIGWIFFFTFFLLSGVNMFKGGSRFTTVIGGWVASEIPFINMFPTFTLSIARIVWSVRAEDKKERLDWEEGNKKRRAELVQRTQMQILQARQAQAAQINAETEEGAQMQEEQELEIEAGNGERSRGGNTAANDELYNPAEEEATSGGEYVDRRPDPANDPVYGGGSGAGYNPQAIPEYKKAVGWR